MAKELVGLTLPNLRLPSTSGEISIPKDLLGRWAVLFFYPKNQTPGCTKEACSFRDNVDNFLKLNAQIFGVSKDGIDSHEQFIAKYHLNYPLVSDADRNLAKALGVSSFLGINSRDTFLIDPQGKIAFCWRKVNATKTMEETLAKLKSLMAAT